MAVQIVSPSSLRPGPEPEAAPGAGTWIRRFESDDPSGWGARHHDQHLIAWVSDGDATAQVGDCRWALPPMRAIWVPSGTPCELMHRRASTLHCVQVGPDECPLDWREPVVLAVTPMLRELLLTLGASARRRTRISEAAETFLFSLLRPLSQTPLQLPLPTDYRAVALAQAVLTRPADQRTLDDWADRFDTSASTLRHAFVDETGMTFDEWRTQSRLRASLSLLADRMPVETVAGKVGYAGPSEFVEAFRRHFGHTPGRSFTRASA